MSKVFRLTPDCTAPLPGEEVEAVEISISVLCDLATGLAPEIAFAVKEAKIIYTPDGLSLSVTLPNGEEVSHPLAKRVTKFRAYVSLTNLSKKEAEE